MKKTVPIVLVVFVLGFGAYQFLSNSNKTLKKNENPKPTSAIAQAAMPLEGKDFRDEARQLFGLYPRSSQEDTYLQFKKRLFANSQLASTFESVKKEEVVVFLGDKFDVGAGFVDVTVNVTDEEIIDFLSNSVMAAKAKWVELGSLRDEAFQYGIRLGGSNTVEEYKQMRARLSSNEDLASAFRAAAYAQVAVYLDDEFSVGRGWVDIDVSAADREIIDFLLGK